MSETNVEVVRRIYEEINARLEFPPEWFAPDCVTDWTDVAPEGEVMHGIEATNALIASYFGTFDNFHSSPWISQWGSTSDTAQCQGASGAFTCNWGYGNLQPVTDPTAPGSGDGRSRLNRSIAANSPVTKGLR